MTVIDPVKSKLDETFTGAFGKGNEILKTIDAFPSIDPCTDFTKNENEPPGIWLETVYVKFVVLDKSVNEVLFPE